MSPGPHKQFDRVEVLERAMELFWERGYDSTGVSDLLAHMGVGRQSLYNTFGDKRALFTEALNHYFRSRIGPVLAQLRAPGSPLANLEGLFAMWVEQAQKEVPKGCLLGRAVVDLEMSDDNRDLAERARGYFDAVADAFTDLARRGQAAGEFTTRFSAEDLGGLLVTMTQGAAMMSKITPQRAERVLESILQIVRAET